MKEVIAILRLRQWRQTKERLLALGITSYHQRMVYGRGKQLGLKYLPKIGTDRSVGIRYLPKRMVTWVVEDAQVKPLIQAIMEENRTGQIGDGKIFVCPIEEVAHIRTGQRGTAALHPKEEGESIHV